MCIWTRAPVPKPLLNPDPHLQGMGTAISAACKTEKVAMAIAPALTTVSACQRMNCLQGVRCEAS